MAPKKAAGSTPALQALERSGIHYVLHPYEHDARAESYGLEAADVLGFDPARVFKTLVADVDGALVVGVGPVSTPSTTTRSWSPQVVVVWTSSSRPPTCPPSPPPPRQASPPARRLAGRASVVGCRTG